MTDLGTATDAGYRSADANHDSPRLAYTLIVPLPWLEKRCLDA
jgi:hypothetical protein